jgi:hypothetical protein
MQSGHQEYQAERANTHALEHAERAWNEAEVFLGVDRVTQHAKADERAPQVDFLSSVEHGCGL